MNPDDLDAKHNLELALKQLPPQDQDEQQDSPEAQPPQAQPPPQSSQDPPPPQDQPPPQEPQAEPLTEEQARQALEAVGENAQTLQERREQTLISSQPPDRVRLVASWPRDAPRTIRRALDQHGSRCNGDNCRDPAGQCPTAAV